jgi:molybdopterin-guanine dinucleotide biosynthesis protein A
MTGEDSSTTPSAESDSARRADEHTVSGAVLVGGSSRRMGEDKALLPVDGVPMAVRVVAALEAGGCREVVLVGGDVDTRLVLGRRHIGDPPHLLGRGPIAGVVAALDDAAGRRRPAAWGTVEAAPTGVLVAATDLPDLTAAAVVALRTAFLGAATTRAVPVPVVAVTLDGDGARRHPALAVWPVAAGRPLTERLADASAPRSLHAALDLLGAIEVTIDRHAAFNANSPSDLRRRH